MRCAQDGRCVDCTADADCSGVGSYCETYKPAIDGWICHGDDDKDYCTGDGDCSSASYCMSAGKDPMKLHLCHNAAAGNKATRSPKMMTALHHLRRPAAEGHAQYARIPEMQGQAKKNNEKLGKARTSKQKHGKARKTKEKQRKAVRQGVR